MDYMAHGRGSMGLLKVQFLRTGMNGKFKWKSGEVTGGVLMKHMGQKGLLLSVGKG